MSEEGASGSVEQTQDTQVAFIVCVAEIVIAHTEVPTPGIHTSDSYKPHTLMRFILLTQCGT